MLQIEEVSQVFHAKDQLMHGQNKRSLTTLQKNRLVKAETGSHLYALLILICM